MNVIHKIEESTKKYSVELHLDKEISKEEIHNILVSDFPDKLRKDCKELADNMGYSCDLDVIVADGQSRNFIELHALYKHEYEPFLLQMIYSCVKRHFAITDIRFYM